MPSILPRRLLTALIALLLAACGASASNPSAPAEPTASQPLPTTIAQPSAPPATTVATNKPAATFPPAPTETPEPASTPAPDAAPTAASMPAAQPAFIRALYACKPGFCRYTLGEQAAEALITALDPALHGYAFTPDGAGILLGQDAYASSDVEILLMNSDMLDVRTVAMVTGMPSGAGGLEGYGAIGMTDDGQRVIFEDQAQLFISNLDGSQRHAVMEPRPYGASSTHHYALSPSGLRVLYTTSGQPNQFKIAGTESGALHSFSLGSDRRALALIDDQHVLIERFEPPFDPNGANPAGVERWNLGYEVAPITGDRLGQPAPLRAGDGSFARSAISNVAGDWLLISDDVARAGAGAPEQPDPLWLLNVQTGARQDISLPLYDGYSQVAIALVR